MRPPAKPVARSQEAFERDGETARYAKHAKSSSHALHVQMRRLQTCMPDLFGVHHVLGSVRSGLAQPGFLINRLIVLFDS
ncbi:hypothetical protein CDEST_03409 [Colletotrichum destructivum]|uniref:Uncharacterized protein n=1 Tax=Colletotrichum destructivum TaxID=34406 RepID=A0AAX4I543_9PEZI|nr:hypothetical protein CDEST_03409 [Colletotrichum destructivum]